MVGLASTPVSDVTIFDDSDDDIEDGGNGVRYGGEERMMESCMR